MPGQKRWILVILLVGSSLGCRTPGSDRPTVLPLSVALLPFEITQVRRSVGKDTTKLDLSVHLDADRLNERLAAALEERCFSEVRLVSDRGPAVEAGIDLVVETLVEYTPEVHTRGGSFYYVNLAMHLTGGPFCYFIKDCSYLSPAEIVVQIHDVDKIANDEGTLEDRQARLLFASSRFAGADLSFVQRNDQVGNYLLSLLVPVGFIARETDKIRARVEEAMIQSLVDGIAEEMQRKRQELLLPDTLAARFYIDPETIRTTKIGNGRIRLEGEVVHQPGQRKESLDHLEAPFDEPNREFAFAPSRLDPRMGSSTRPFYRSRFDVELPVAKSAKTVRLRIWDTDDSQRSFTVRIEE